MVWRSYRISRTPKRILLVLRMFGRRKKYLFPKAKSKPNPSRGKLIQSWKRSTNITRRQRPRLS